MHKVISGVILALMSTSALADTHVRGYYRKDGTYVQPHYRSDANNTTRDNWTTRGNVNPHTGAIGTRDTEDKPSRTYNSRLYEPEKNNSPED